MKALFKPISLQTSHRIEAGDGHVLHVSECGVADGVPVVVLHGGPGSGCRPHHGRFFDPRRYRIILPDQRGSGRSLPRGEIRHNHTATLIEDLELVRRYLGIERWMLFGGSWGATLALAYARAYPDLVSAMLLRGVFLGRERDLYWLFGPDGVARLFPDAWAAFKAELSSDEDDVVSACCRAICHEDEPIALKAARAWTRWADQVLNGGLAPSWEAAMSRETEQRLLAKVRIEAHYAAHRYFISDDPLLESVSRLPKVPVSIVHGRADLICTAEASWQLHQALPGSRLLRPEAGHLETDPAMVDALVGETQRMAGLLA